LQTNQKTAPVLDDNAGERMVPEISDRFTFWEHVYRYAFASRFVKGKRVLDIACGEGYGAAALQRTGASHVIGVDISEPACLHAHRKYGIDARVGSAERIPLPDNSVDVVVSFETIEHVPDPGRFLDECARVLAPGGRVVISTPNTDVYSGRLGTRNPHHCSEMTEGEFASAVRARFQDAHFYTQRPESAVWWSLRTLNCESTPWGHIRGFRRLRQGIQRRIFPEAVSDPTDEQRASVVNVIVEAARSQRRLLNQFVVRAQRRWQQEKPVYIIVVAAR
jgi:SAM-dependent methyltransferase